MMKSRYNVETDSKEVLNTFFHAEFGTYMTMYGPERTVLSVQSISKSLSWTKYHVQKVIRRLKEMGLVERASVGCPAIESVGEYRELVCDARPPMNGFAVTDKCYKTKEYKRAYEKWTKNLEEWANGGKIL